MTNTLLWPKEDTYHRRTVSNYSQRPSEVTCTVLRTSQGQTLTFCFFTWLLFCILIYERTYSFHKRWQFEVKSYQCCYFPPHCFFMSDNPVKNLISQRCHGEIMIHSQLPHTSTSLQHHFEAAHRTNHDINWWGHTCEFPASSLWGSWGVADYGPPGG